MHRRTLLGLGVLAAMSLGAGSAAAEDISEADVRAFLVKNCQRCHGAEKPKADRRLDVIGTDFSDADTLVLWQDVLDQLNLGEMPPATAPRPDAAETQRVIEWITERLTAAQEQQASTGSRTVFRRLNRVEYDRTVRQLLSLEDMLADPTEGFPPDETVEGLDNIGSALVTSDFLMQNYLKAADLLVTRATAFGPRPETRSYHFEAPFCPTGNRHDGQDVPGEYQNIRKSTADEGGHLWLARFKEGVPQAGYYRLRFKAEGVNRDYPYAESLIGVRRSEPLRVRVVAGSSAYGDLEHRTSSDRPVAEFELPDGEPTWFEARIWLDAGYQPRLTFPNGPPRVKSLRMRLIDEYPESFPEFIGEYVNRDKKHFRDGYRPTEESIAEARKSQRLTTAGTSRSINSRAGWSTFYREYQGPRVRVHEIELEGPLFDEWPPASHTALYGDSQPTAENAEAILRRFAERAFRRPATEEELAPLVELMKKRQAQGDSAEEAVAAGLKGVLCSPAFLYLEEGEGALGDYALASRLSYFLWSSPPDEPLLEAAARGELKDPEVLRAQAARMLDDPRSDAFVERFTSRWLELYKIGSMPPDPARFRPYYIDELEPAMKEEARLYFRHLLDENLPIDLFLDSDFTFVNSGLARLYGIEGVSGAAFRKVSLSDRRRGGLLGQAAILTASANGIDTSPVIRGIWVLENVLGTPPSPPPPDVEPLEPDIRGATTIRDQLEKHRNVEACAQCHQKIDPLGFALENFDAIGGWRERYGRDRGPVVDASGRLPDGREFQDIAGLKELLKQRREQFARCLGEKLLAYATGRTIERGDRAAIDRIVAELDRRGGGLKELVLLTVSSEAFRTN